MTSVPGNVCSPPRESRTPSIHDGLVELLGKSIAESNALCIPTAAYRHPMSGLGGARRGGSSQNDPAADGESGWKSLGVLELTAHPSIDEALWAPKSTRPTAWAGSAALPE